MCGAKQVSMQNRFIHQLCLTLGLAWPGTQALGQATVQLLPESSSGTHSLTASNLPATSVAVIWRSDGPLAKGDHWSAVHAFPADKLKSAALPIRPGATGASFFKLSWQDIVVPKNMIWLPLGDFSMGSPEDEAGRFKDEGPVHSVTIPHGFWMDRYEVTQQQFKKLMVINPSSTDYTANLPVNKVTWHEANEYCERLTKLEKQRNSLPLGYVYRLPTEAEWEYACRAGTDNAYSYGDNTKLLSQYGWWAGNSKTGRPSPVGSLTPNPWGFYDIHGNVFEWCLDTYRAYPGGSAFSDSGKLKVLRGGAYYCPRGILRSACRAEPQEPEYRWILAGFRVVLAPPLGQAED